MSDMTNPYQSPEADIKIEKPLIAQGSLTGNMVMYLKGASPWLRFMGIMGFIGSGFLILAGLFFLIFMPMVINFFEDAAFVFSSYFGSAGPLMFFYTLYCFAAGVIVFFPALFTYRFGAKIKNYLLTNSEAELETALKNNQSLWKFNGILVIIGLAIVPVVMVIGIVIAVAALAIG